MISTKCFFLKILPVLRVRIVGETGKRGLYNMGYPMQTKQWTMMPQCKRTGTLRIRKLEKAVTKK